jgi:hypothetical protein
MPDFLDRFGDQLRTAQAAANLRETQRSASRGRSRRLRRSSLATLVVLGVAAPALAVVQPWNPVIGRPDIDGPVATDSTPVADAAIDALAVLRRPQTAEDQAAAATKLSAIGNQINDVQTAGIRALRNGWVLVPANTVKTGPDEASSSQLCITNGGVVACSPAASAGETGVALVSASATETRLVGLVPDGVARVRFTRADGGFVESDVQSNFYDLSVPEVAPTASVKAPAGYDGPSTIPAPPRPIAGSVSWLNGDGQVIGPTPRGTSAG